MKRFPLPTVLTAAALVVLLIIYAVTTQVRFSEQAVKVRWGKAATEPLAPGLHFYLPLVESVHKYDTRLRMLDTPETEVTTQDGQTIIVGCYVLWRVQNALQFHTRLGGNALDAESTLRTRINQARASVLGQHSMSELVNLDAEVVSKSHQQIYAEMKAAVHDALLSNYGVEIVQVGIRRVTMPEEATQTILQAMSSERLRLAAKYTEEGKAMAETIKASAKASADQIRSFVGSKAAEIESAGTKAAQRTLAQIQAEDADFFIWLRYLDALQSALRQRSTIFIDSGSDLFQVFNRPTATVPTAGSGAMGTRP